MSSLNEVTDELLSKWENIQVAFVLVSVTASIDGELTIFILDERHAPSEVHHGMKPGSPEYDRLKEAYAELGRRLYHVVTDSVGRFLAFCRSSKGQHWVDEHPWNPDFITSFNNGCGAQFSLDGLSWHRWCPPLIDTINCEIQGAERFVAAKDWSSAQAFFSGTNRTEAVLEILANAEQLFSSNNHRSAIVEAVSALETAINALASKPGSGLLLSEEVREVLGDGTLQRVVTRLGLTATATVLLPLILPKADVPDGLLALVGTAIDCRQNVVHNSQRAIDPKKLRLMIEASRRLCEILKRHTREPETIAN